MRGTLEAVYKKLTSCPPSENFLDIVYGKYGQVGYIQYGYHKNVVELSIDILQQYHGRDIATEAIKLACRRFKGKIVAYIREDNMASQKAFRKSGFEKTEYGELRYLENLDKYVCMELWEFNK